MQFAIGFSLTLTIHFYSTMVAGLFCIGVAAGFCFRFVRWKYFRRIMVTGILSVLISVLPMAAGVAMGKGLQGSLYWGMSVITGGKDEDADTESISSQVEASSVSADSEMGGSGGTSDTSDTLSGSTAGEDTNSSALSESQVEELRKEGWQIYSASLL